jgi:Flp pilus assembly pilin Flp
MLKLFTFVQAHAAPLRDREEGQTMAEYGVVLALITLAVVATIGFLGTAINDKFQAVLDVIS